MINSGSGNNSYSSDFLKVLLALKQNISSSINVAEVCIIQSHSNGKYVCKCMSSDDLVECYALKNLSLNDDDIVLVLYTDVDFRANLKRLKSGLKSQTFKQDVKHTKDCGIIIGLI